MKRYISIVIAVMLVVPLLVLLVSAANVPLGTIANTTSGGVTINYSSSTSNYTLNGAASSTVSIVSPQFALSLVTGRTYSFSATTVSGSFTGSPTWRLYAYNSSGTLIWYSEVSPNGVPASFVYGSAANPVASRFEVISLSRSGTSYANNVVSVRLDDGTTPPAPTYTITFNGNGGTPAVPTLITGTDGRLNILPVANRTDYTLNGWFTAPSGGTQITTSTVFTANTTVYAQWTYVPPVIPPDPTYTITFDGNGGTPSTSSMVTGTNGRLTSLPTANRTDFTFDGWFSSASGGAAITTNTVFTANTTVYAQWTAVPPVVPPTPPPVPPPEPPPPNPPSVDMGKATIANSLPVGYVSPVYYSMRSFLDHLEYHELVLYSADFDTYLHFFYQGNLIITPLSAGGFSYQFESVNSVRGVYASKADGTYFDEWLTTDVRNTDFERSYAWSRIFKQVRSQSFSNTTENQYNFFPSLYFNDNSALLDISGSTSFLPVALSYGTGGGVARFTNGAEYQVVNNQVVLVNADTLPNDVIYSLSLAHMNRYLNHVGYSSLVVNQVPQQIGSGLDDAGNTIDDWASQVEQYETTSEDAILQVTQGMAAFSPLFLGVWNALPSWFTALLAVSLAVVIGRKIMGR